MFMLLRSGEDASEGGRQRERSSAGENPGKRGVSGRESRQERRQRERMSARGRQWERRQREMASVYEAVGM